MIFIMARTRTRREKAISKGLPQTKPPTTFPSSEFIGCKITIISILTVDCKWSWKNHPGHILNWNKTFRIKISTCFLYGWNSSLPLVGSSTHCDTHRFVDNRRNACWDSVSGPIIKHRHIVIRVSLHLCGWVGVSAKFNTIFEWNQTRRAFFLTIFITGGLDSPVVCEFYLQMHEQRSPSMNSTWGCVARKRRTTIGVWRVFFGQQARVFSAHAFAFFCFNIMLNASSHFQSTWVKANQQLAKLNSHFVLFALLTIFFSREQRQASFIPGLQLWFGFCTKKLDPCAISMVAGIPICF